MKDQWYCVLNDLEELGDKEFLVPDESVQYWNIFLFPPPFAIFLFHMFIRPMLRVLFRRKSFILQNLIAPSSSRCRWPWRRRVLSCFDTGWAMGETIFWLNVGPSSFSNGYSSCWWAGRSTSSWFCFSLWSGSQKQVHSFSTQNLRTAFQRFPERCCRLHCCCSSPWPTFSSHEKFWPTSENCLCLQDSILISTPYSPFR